VNPGDDLPLYRQIMRQITEAIAGGHLRPGDKLLSHRDLAEQLVIAPLTVKKAYDELELEGLIETQRGKGTFISEQARVSRGTQRERLKEPARRLLSQAYLSGFSYTDVLEILKDADRQIQSGKGAGKVRTE
jgi:GntR family transcriptional regulator